MTGRRGRLLQFDVAAEGDQRIALIILSGWEGRRYFASPDWRDGIELVRFVVAYTANAFGIWLFRYYGFTAALLQRMSGYAIWHVAWPLLRV